MKMPRPLLLPLLAGAGRARSRGRGPGPRPRATTAEELADHRRPQRPALGHPREPEGPDGRGGLRPAGEDRGSHRPRAPSRGRSRRPVLVGLHPGRDPRRLRPHAARADRHRAARDRALSGRARGRRHRGRGQAGHEARARGVDARRRGRSRHRELARSPACVLRPGRALHDPHPHRDPGLGGRRRRHPAPLGSHPVRRGSRAGDESPRHARRPVARDPGDHGRRDPRVRSARHLLALVGEGHLRPRAQRARQRARRCCRRTGAS